jgi:hypothetical protein
MLGLYGLEMRKISQQRNFLYLIKLEVIVLRNVLKTLYFNSLSRFSEKTLAENHFRFWSKPDHVNLNAFKKIEELMDKKPQIIIETGTSAWGTESTRFWDTYIRKYGGELWSVDIRPEPKTRLRYQTSRRTHLIVGDSVEFLKTNNVISPTIVFLDSWDVDWSNPEPASEHGFRELASILAKLTSATHLIVDDTPSKLDYIAEENRKIANEYLRREGVLPGKGAKILQTQNELGLKPIFHEYALILKVLNRKELRAKI